MTMLLSALALAIAAVQPVPVVVELFTSEGCSSCPPADAVLEGFVRERAVAGAEVVALSEHVDYWDDLGWRDPYSSPDATRRQAAYARRLGSDVYTPQLVVNGGRQLLGSDGRAARAAIAAAAAAPRGDVSLRLGDGALEISARWAGDAPAEVVVAWVQERATSHVPRGENAGRTLAHVAVARSVSTIGRGRGRFEGRVDLAGAPATADRVVVLVQEPDGGPVRAAAVAPLPRRVPSRGNRD